MNCSLFTEKVLKFHVYLKYANTQSDKNHLMTKSEIYPFVFLGNQKRESKICVHPIINITKSIISISFASPKFSYVLLPVICIMKKTL